jgi:hypothetical protein
MTPKTKYALLATSLFLGLSGLTWWLYQPFFRDGIGPTGQWDDEGGTTKQPHTVAGSELNYEQSPIIMSHFDIREFDSPDQPGSGVYMKIKFLEMLDAAREQAGIPLPGQFRLPDSGAQCRRGRCAGFRAYAGLGGGYRGADTGAEDQDCAGCQVWGFNRFGIYDTFVHLDCDPGKRGDVAWNGKGYAVGRGGDFSGWGFDPFAV